MVAVLIAILALTVLGIPFVLAVDRDASPLRLLGLAFLYGTGAMYFVLLALSVLHVRWTLISVTIAALIVMLPFVRRPVGAHGVRPRLHALDLLALVTPICFALFATATALSEWDFFAIWGLKARAFFEVGGIDWRFLGRSWNTFVHPDYPLLVPFAYDFAALVGGGWSDRWLGLLFVAWALAFLLVARDLAGSETTPRVAALVAIVLSSLGVSHFVGLAEGTLIAYVGAGVLFVRRAMLDDDSVAWRHGAILLGLAACTKNEGLAMLASTAAAVVVSDVSRWRRVVRLWPAAALALPWLVLRALHDLPTDVVAGSLASRLATRLPQAGKILAMLVGGLYNPWFWAALLLGILAVPLAVWKGERFVLLATLFQLAVYIGIYFVTPYNPAWHIATSWPRLTAQVSAPVAYAVLIVLAREWRNAEARPEQP